MTDDSDIVSMCREERVLSWIREPQPDPKVEAADSGEALNTYKVWRSLDAPDLPWFEPSTSLLESRFIHSYLKGTGARALLHLHEDDDEDVDGSEGNIRLVLRIISTNPLYLNGDHLDEIQELWTGRIRRNSSRQPKTGVPAKLTLPPCWNGRWEQVRPLSLVAVPQIVMDTLSEHIESEEGVKPARSQLSQVGFRISEELSGLPGEFSFLSATFILD